VVLDNEGVQALSSSTHPKHAQVIAHVQVVAHRKAKAIPLDILAPTAVRVEAGWDRRARSAALINHLRIADVPLDTPSADVAAELVVRLQVSVADAHLGATVASVADRGAVAIITSDPADMAAVSGPVPVTIVTI
jgi:predicted nucleic acid-binding protein